MGNEAYMQRCFDLASKGLASVSPNPLVGCVIVAQGQIIGEGFHEQYGKAHAEVNAVQRVLERFGETEGNALLKEATVYVNLEPCAHVGKTPPCADLLVKKQVKKVVIANPDPFEGVNGKGIQRLQQHGIEVLTGVLTKEGEWLNRRFFTRIRKKRPYFILKWAETSDGYFAPLNNQQRWITGQAARKLTHQWRHEEDAILVGSRTALIDDPLLNVREQVGNDPIRVLVDRGLNVPSDHRLFQEGARTLVLNELESKIENHVQWIQMEDMKHYLPQKIAYQLYLLDLQSVIIEGGATLLSLFIENGLWDEIRKFTSPSIWGEGLPAPKVQSQLIESYPVGEDLLTISIPFSFP